MSEKVKEILDMCERYNFYHISVYRMLMKFDGKAFADRVCLKNWGFAILKHYGPDVSIEFIFVRPEHRRKGHFTKFIGDLQRSRLKAGSLCDKFGVSLTISPENEVMIYAVTKLGFVKVCKCRSGNEDYYRFPCATMDNF